ncbi:MAG: NTP transferase domain-containing protein [Dongiaceae bacterium]
MKAVILSAGQGSRLLPLTADRPKCLLPLDGKTLIEWQIAILRQCGVSEIVVVVGFRAAMVEELLARLGGPDLAIRTVFNPFYGVADNLGSCWLARHEMDRDFLIVNGDTLFEAEVPRRLLASQSAPITVTIDRKSSYDADDMKVRLDGSRLLEIGKMLPPDRINGESIGLLLFRGEGPGLFREAVERAMRSHEGLTWWYLKVIGQLAKSHPVETLSIAGLGWGEVDYPADLMRAQKLVAGWRC